MTSRRVAARYAEALFGLAQARASVETVRAELQALVGLIAQTPALASLLERPDLEAERKLAAATAALEGQFSAIVTSLLAVLLRHRRGDQVGAVAEAFAEMADDAAGVVKAEATTVVPLTPVQRSRLTGALSRITGRRVVLAERVEPEVLAGVRVQVGDRLIDGSAAGRLERMREELVAVEGARR